MNKIYTFQLDAFDAGKYINKINRIIKNYKHVIFFDNANGEIIESSIDLIIAYSNSPFTLKELKHFIR